MFLDRHATRGHPDHQSVKLACGLRLTIARAREADQAGIAAMYRRLSPETLYLRHFMKSIPRDEPARACAAADSGGRSLLARHPGIGQPVVACAYYVVTPGETPPSAEAAIVVEDRLQGLGLGRALFERLLTDARSRGVESLELNLLAHNQRALRTFLSAGYPAEVETRMGHTRLLLNLKAGAAGRTPCT